MTDCVDKKYWSKRVKKAYDAGRTGVNCDVMAEGLPEYIKAPCEDVIKGKNNTWIVLGRDRPGAEDTGYGGQGCSHAGMISIVAGRLSQKAGDKDIYGNQAFAEPNHRTDAAFIYISQKTDIDKNLKLEPESEWNESKAKSAIGIKADNLRLVARQGIKLVTGVDDKLSDDGDSIATYGIDLVAGNNTEDIQPMVKGKNLVECLQRFKEEISKLNGALVGFVKYQLDFNIASLGHFHTITIPIAPSLPSALTAGNPQMQVGKDVIIKQANRTLRSLGNQRWNLKQLNQQYLEPGDAEKGKTSYINSKYNNVN